MNAPISQNDFIPGTRLDRSPTNLLDARDFYASLRSLVLHQTSLSDLEAIDLVRSRDSRNIQYGGEQSIASVEARTRVDTGMKAVVRHLREGRKIEAIKEYRALSGVSLKEAKDFVESMQGMPGQVISSGYGSSQSKDYIVLSKEAGYGGQYNEEGKYAHAHEAEASARRVCERDPEDQVLLVKVVGRTRATFSMQP